MALVQWMLVVEWHWWRGIGAVDAGGGVALVHWILVVSWHLCCGSGGSVALVH